MKTTITTRTARKSTKSGSRASAAIRGKLAALRDLMKRHGIDAYLVPTGDEHRNEYVPGCWKRRPWLSGFTGSWGDVVVTASEAGLWTDGRYFLQAEEELRGTGIRLFRAGEPGVPTVKEFVAAKLAGGGALGIDPRLVSMDDAVSWRTLLESEGARLVAIDENLIDLIWTDRPPFPAGRVQVLSQRFSGESVRSKLGRVRKEMKNRRADALVVTLLDQIAWLFNIRGEDVEFNPVAIAYAIVTPQSATLYIHLEKVSAAARKKLGPAVTVEPYGEFEAACRRLAAEKPRIWLHKETASFWVGELFAGCRTVTDRTPISTMKAKKNETEIAGMRAAHVRDGVAMVRFLRWLEASVAGGNLTEGSAAQHLAELRSRGEHFQGLSFDTISGYGGHGAIIHYRVTEKSDVPLRPDGLYLIDSGGQYLDGTTDITRTVLLGKRATPEQRERFTRVLKGHIALSRAVFPSGVNGVRLDTLAREALWDVGLDYKHGTGHGVGAFLCVHEGPQSISTRDSGVPLEEGNILSNEPGFYEAGRYGMRIENLILVRRDEKRSRGNGMFLSFETLTLCPIDRRLIEPRLLTDAERAWVNDYHRRVERTLGPLLDPEERRWLKSACAPL